jgi:dethiobiotin synthetase
MTEPVRCLGVTGTDTGIGKTVVSCALAARARQLGLRVAAMKPLESGLTERPVLDGRVQSDGERLRDAAGGTDDLALVRPYALEEPLAPMVAAQRAGVTIDLAVLDAARDQLARDRDLLLVEGAGGLLVPITDMVSYATLFRRWGGDVVVVAGNRLGVINHVLLTVRVAEAEGLTVRGIVLTALTDGDPTVAEATNYDALATLLPRHMLRRFPWVDRGDDTEALALAACASGLDTLLMPQVAADSLPDR